MGVSIFFFPDNLVVALLACGLTGKDCIAELMLKITCLTCVTYNLHKIVYRQQRIIGYLELERTHKGSSSPAPFSSQDYLKLII